MLNGGRLLEVAVDGFDGTSRVRVENITSVDDLKTKTAEPEAPPVAAAKKPVLRLTGFAKAGASPGEQTAAFYNASRISTLRALNEQTNAYPGENFDLIDPRQIDEVRDYMIGLGVKPKAPPQAPKPAEAAKAALESGTYEQAKPAVVALGRQIIAEGHTTLAPFTRRLKELLGDTYAKLKGKIKDIYEAAKSDAGFLRLPERKKPEGKDNQRGSVRKFARRMLTRDGGRPRPSPTWRTCWAGRCVPSA